MDTPARSATVVRMETGFSPDGSREWAPGLVPDVLRTKRFYETLDFRPISVNHGGTASAGGGADGSRPGVKMPQIGGNAGRRERRVEDPAQGRKNGAGHEQAGCTRSSGPRDGAIEECAGPIGQSAELGFDIIEAPALDPGSIDVDFTRRELEKNGIAITFSLGLDAATGISSGDADKARKGEARLKRGRWRRARPQRLACLRHPLFRLPEIQPRRRRRTASPVRWRCCVEGGRDRGGERHHPRARSGQPLRDQRAQHRLPRRSRWSGASARPT